MLFGVEGSLVRGVSSARRFSSFCPSPPAIESSKSSSLFSAIYRLSSPLTILGKKYWSNVGGDG